MWNKVGKIAEENPEGMVWRGGPNGVVGKAKRGEMCEENQGTRTRVDGRHVFPVGMHDGSDEGDGRGAQLSFPLNIG